MTAEPSATAIAMAAIRTQARREALEEAAKILSDRSDVCKECERLNLLGKDFVMAKQYACREEEATISELLIRALIDAPADPATARVSETSAQEVVLVVSRPGLETNTMMVEALCPDWQSRPGGVVPDQVWKEAVALVREIIQSARVRDNPPYVTVPREPTAEMIDAALRASGKEVSIFSVVSIYRAMLAAAEGL